MPRAPIQPVTPADLPGNVRLGTVTVDGEQAPVAYPAFKKDVSLKQAYERLYEHVESKEIPNLKAAFTFYFKTGLFYLLPFYIVAFLLHWAGEKLDPGVWPANMSPIGGITTDIFNALHWQNGPVRDIIDIVLFVGICCLIGAALKHKWTAKVLQFLSKVFSIVPSARQITNVLRMFTGHNGSGGGKVVLVNFAGLRAFATCNRELTIDGETLVGVTFYDGPNPSWRVFWATADQVRVIDAMSPTAVLEMALTQGVSVPDQLTTRSFVAGELRNNFEHGTEA